MTLPLLVAALSRGPGFYFNVPALLAVVVVFFAWAWALRWVDRDAAKLDVPREMWNLLVLASGALGLVVAFALPVFFLAFPALLLLAFAPVLGYVYVRNQEVPADRTVLTPSWFRRLAKEHLGMSAKAATEGGGRDVPVRFIGKGTDEREEDPSRVARAERSRGYQTALELVYDAIQARATDIHMEPSREDMAVRFRVDSMLAPHQTLDRPMGESVLNIFKVLAALDITEKRKPQDGSFSAEVESRGVDFRVATAGSVAGEKLVMRILDQSKHFGDLSQLGLTEDVREKLKELIDQPHGMVLVCGPTGAGKSSTLYACLGEIDRYQRNVITLENPVEYQLSNVTQIEVNPKAGKTFASELRSILRQDPDVIMVGEIRDAETAEIACQAAQTGHTVFSTLHANDTVTAIGRLIDLKVQPFLLANAITGLVSQRLIRLLCPKCKVRFRPTEEVLRRFKLHPDKVRFLYRPPEERERVGPDSQAVRCESCGNSGYRGRTGVFELLVITDDLREMIRTSPNLLAIKQAAARAGLVTLADDALRKVLEGKTSLQELQRVAKG